jgi:NitT/TauT family transport system substrate-binding protein
MAKRSLTLFTLVSLLIGLQIGCTTKKNESTRLEKVTLRQQWFPNAGYAGELFAINETGKKNNIEILLQAGADDIDPIKLVLGGQATFGIAGADQILEANEKGAELVVVGTVNYKSLGCFIAKEDKKIYTPKDFESKIVGVQNGTSVYFMYKALLKRGKVDTTKVKEVEAPWDMATFLTDAYDVRPAFYNDETVTLDQKGIKYTVVRPEDYNVNFVGTVYFTTQKIIDEHPEEVQSFVSSLCEGWELALSNPKKSIEFLKIFDKNIDNERELKSLIKGIDYYKGAGGKALASNKEDWDSMASTLKGFGLLHNYDYQKSVNNTFLNWYHENKSK